MTKHRKRTGHRWLLLLCFIVAFCGISLFLFTERGTKAVYAVAEEGRLYEKITVRGLFLYDETVVTAPAAGTFYGGFAEGDGVAVHEVCGELHRLNDLFSEPVEVITSPVSGILSYNLDGWENILTPASVGQLDLPSLFDGYETGESSATSFVYAGDACFKVMDNKKDLYLLVDLGTMMPENKKIRLSFGKEEITGEVVSLRRYGEGCFALVQMAPMGEAYRSRYVEMEWIQAEREGVLVDSSALTERFGETGVYRSEKGKLSFSPVTVVCSDGVTSLVEGISAGDCVLCGKS